MIKKRPNWRFYKRERERGLLNHKKKPNINTIVNVKMCVCRSKRKGYLHYAMGQLRQMGKQFYDTDIHVEVLSEQLVGDYSHVTMR